MLHTPVRRWAMLITLVATTACSWPARSDAQSPLGIVGGVAKVTVYATGLENPWSLAFLPDGRALVTERPGRMRIVGTDGSLSAPLAGVPAVQARGQGGLLDVALDPGFADNHTIWFTYSEPSGDKAGTAVARARLGDAGLEDVQVILRQEPKVEGANHFGSRLAFARDGKLFVTFGERQRYRDSAQSLTATFGKVVRINPDGSIPPDNPFVGRNDARPEIWSYGHRNPQGAAVHPVTGVLWTIEHGARGGDELNHPQPGRNYGWPVITYGKDYSGAKIGEGTAKAGMEQPVHYWDPSIAPSGLLIYTGDRFPTWTGSFIIGAMAGQGLTRLTVRENGPVPTTMGQPAASYTVTEERMKEGIERRIRDVRQGPDGLVYLLTDASAGEILRLEPR